METFVCPLCHKTTSDFPALSRVDNKTAICSDCGTTEALDDFFGDQDFVNVIISGELRRIHRDAKKALDDFISRNNNN